MRFSPVLVAFLAATATLGLANTVKGQTADAALTQASNQSAATVGADAATVISNPLATRAATAIKPSDRLRGLSVPSTSQPVTTSRRSQSIPPPIAQAGPGQETPNQIQITPSGPLQSTPSTAPTAPSTIPASPPSAPSTPTPSAPAPEATPTPEATPAPSIPSTPETTPAPGAPATTPPSEQEPPVLVGEVVVQGVEGEIQQQVYQVIRTQPGRTTTRTQLQEDINAIFAIGYFSNVRAVPTDTPLGVRVTFEVQLNPVLQKVQLEGTTLLPEPVITDAFSDQYGKVLNLVQLQEGIKKVNKWYQDNGYVLAQVVDAPQVSPDGVVTLQVAEGVVENIQVRFVDKDGNECARNDQGKFFLRDAQGNPVLNKEGKPSGCRVRTRDFIVTREFELKPGQVFNRTKVERDLQRTFGLGIFEDVKLSLSPGQDPRKVIVVANVVEKNSGSIAAGAGISSASGLFGTVSYQQQNLGGNNQKLGAEVQIGQRELLFDLNFTDPWIAGDPFRTSYTVNLFRRQTISLIFDGGKPDINLPNGDTPRVVRTGGGVSFSRPLNGNPYARSEWAGSLGAQYQRVRINDGNGRLSPRDELGNNLSFSGTGKDDLFTVQLGVVRDRRNDLLRPTAGSLLRLGTEQSVPIGTGSIFFNRLRASYSFYVPTRLLRLAKACRDPKAKPADCPQAFAFNVQGGTVLGDLPPYEAFALGGSNSVRGYDEGDLGSAKSFIQATAEYRFPVFSVISGALFVDAATDFGSGKSVPGNPGGVRGKPGEGFGYGLGLRIQSPLGPIRIDFGVNDRGNTQFHFGIGERFLMEQEVKSQSSHRVSQQETSSDVLAATNGTESRPNAKLWAAGRQHTLQTEFVRSGVGLHTGLAVQVRVLPAPVGRGRYFVRVDKPGAPEVGAQIAAVHQTTLSTELVDGAATVRTVEHLLAALAGMGITNARIEIDGPEVPLLDGSAKEWVEAIAQAGSVAQTETCAAATLEEPLWVRDGDAFVAALPSSELRFTYGIAFDLPAIGKQWHSWSPTEAGDDTFATAIAPARTFGLAHQIDALRDRGLIKGGTLDNALVCGPNGWLNPPLRFLNEPVRHKLLDLVGDLSLLRHFPTAHFLAYKASHHLHTQLARAIVALNG